MNPRLFGQSPVQPLKPEIFLWVAGLFFLLLNYASVGYALPTEIGYEGTELKWDNPAQWVNCYNNGVPSDQTTHEKDECNTAALPIGFDFEYYGTTYTEFYVNTNGFISFVKPWFWSSKNKSIPDATTGKPKKNYPTAYIAAFWDDLDSRRSNGRIFYKTIGSTPNRKLVVQWTNIGFYGKSNPLGTFQAILYETSNNIQTQYRQLLGTGRYQGNEATVGIEKDNPTATDVKNGTQYSHNSKNLKSELAVLFTPISTDSADGYDVTDSKTGTASYEGVYIYGEDGPPPDIPNLSTGINPSLGTTNVSTTPATISWPPVNGADSYHLIVSTSPDLSDPIIDESGINGTSFTSDLLSPDTEYYWTVAAENSGGESWTEDKPDFTTDSAGGSVMTVNNCGDDVNTAITLRYAIANSTDGTLIKFGQDCTINLTDTLVLDKDITIDGAGHDIVINGQGNVQPFKVNSGVNATLKNLTIQDGESTGDGGAIENNGNLSVVNVTMKNNHADGNGGAIANNGNLTVVASDITGNSADGDGGGIYNGNGNLDVENTTITQNTADGNGGGIASDGGTTKLEGNEIAENTADKDNDGSGNGGGIYLGPNTTAQLIDNSVHENTGGEAPDVSGDFQGNLNNTINDPNGWTETAIVEPTPTTSSSNDTQESSTGFGPPPPQPNYYLLSVGTPNGHVVSSPAGIDCDQGEGQCQAFFKRGSKITLVTKAPAGLEFSHWGGHPDCANGNLIMTDMKSCMAYFYGIPGYVSPTPQTPNTDQGTASSNGTTSNSTNGTASNSGTGSNHTNNGGNSTNNSGTGNHVFFDNMSGRAIPRGGKDNIFGGFTITGTGKQRVVVKGVAEIVAPGITAGMSEKMATDVDPIIIVQTADTGEFIAENDNWQTDSRAAEIPVHLQPHRPSDAALVLDLPAGVYSVMVKTQKPSFTSVKINTVYTANSDTYLSDISTRGMIQGGNANIITGLIISSPRKVLVTGIALEEQVDPVIDVYELPTFRHLGQNDNWAENPAISPIKMKWIEDKNAALILDLDPGRYLFILSSTTQNGVGLIDISTIE